MRDTVIVARRIPAFQAGILRADQEAELVFEDFFEEVCFFIGVFQFGFEVCQGACPQGDGPDSVVTEFGFGGEV